MRIFLVLLLPLLLVSCYRPIYGERPFGSEATTQQKRLNRIAINNISNELGQQLRNNLIDRMYGEGRPDQTDASLQVGLATTEEDLGLQKDATTLRKKITYIANFVLTDNATRKKLYTGTARTFVSYNKIDAQYGALSSRENSAQRAIRELSDLIVTQLLVYYGQNDYSPTPMTDAELNRELPAAPPAQRPDARTKPEATTPSIFK